MKLIINGVRFLRTHGARAAYRAARRRFGFSSRSGPGRSQPLPYTFACQPVEYEHASAAGGGPPPPRSINWVIPEFYGASGGHRTIFRLTRELEGAGYSVRFHIFGATHYVSDSEATAVMRTHYFPLKATVHLGAGGMRPSEFCVASSWETAYAVRDFGACRRKLYFVQDFEPSFYPASTESVLAEETYRFGFECVCAGRWLARTMREYGNRAVHFDLAYDPAVYTTGPEPHNPRRVVFYARPETRRRGTELGLLALALLKARRPNTEVVIFGTDELPYEPPFEYERAGILGERELAALYRSAAVGLSVSLTNYSSVPQEMLACGLPVVEMDLPSLREAYEVRGGGLRLAAPRPAAIADALSELLALPEDAARRSRAEAVRLVAGLSWEEAGRTFLDFLDG